LRKIYIKIIFFIIIKLKNWFEKNKNKNKIRVVFKPPLRVVLPPPKLLGTLFVIICSFYEFIANNLVIYIKKKFMKASIQIFILINLFLLEINVKVSYIAKISFTLALYKLLCLLLSQCVFSHDIRTIGFLRWWVFPSRYCPRV
jgi:hypothetical protein